MATVVIPEKVRSAARERDLGGCAWIDATSARPWWQARDYVYEQGMVSVGGWRGRLLRVRPARRWEDVATLRHRFRVLYRYDRDIGSVVVHRSDRFDVRFADGGKVGFYVAEEPARTLASDYFTCGPRLDPPEDNEYAAAAVKLVVDTVGDMLAERLVAEVIGGRRVDFGALSATRGGLLHEGDEFPWKSLSTVTMTAPVVGTSELKEKGQVMSRAAITVAGVTASGKTLTLSLDPDRVYNFGALTTLRRLMR